MLYVLIQFVVALSHLESNNSAMLFLTASDIFQHACVCVYLCVDFAVNLFSILHPCNLLGCYKFLFIW